MTNANTRSPYAAVENDPVHESAADWLVRLRGLDVSVEDTIAWQAWLKEDPRHAAAFSGLEAVSRLVRNVRPPPVLSASELAQDSYDGSVPLGEWLQLRPARYSTFRWRRPSMLQATACLLGLTLLLGVLMMSRWRDGWSVPQTVQTAVGENRWVRLPDGSQMTLGGNTEIIFALGEHSRRIELARGEAFFKVAKDPNRPFRVSAGDATVVAVGTEFNVRRASNHVVVSVVEGRVIVEPNSRVLPVALLKELRPRLRTVSVDAGEQTIAGSEGIEDAAKIEDPGATTSWQTGRLSFRLQALKDVLEDVNRYAPKPIVLKDESIGNLVITGTVTRENISGWVSSLERGFGLIAVEEPERIVIRRR